MPTDKWMDKEDMVYVIYTCINALYVIHCIYIYIHIYAKEYYLAIKMSNAICSNMDGSRDYHPK